MALSYGFYNSYDGDRKYNAEQISSMFDGVIQDGVFAEIGEKFMVVPGDGLEVVVKTGKAWFDHTWLVNDYWYPIKLQDADITRNRIDAVVIETDHSVEVRQTTIKIVTGAPGLRPQKPELVETDLVHQHPLAYVTVNAAVTELSGSDIEIRTGFSDCPWITGLLQITAIDDLFNAWDAQFKAFQNSKEQDYQNFLKNANKELQDWMAKNQNEFTTWFTLVKGYLGEDGSRVNAIAGDLADFHLAYDKKMAALDAQDVTLQNNINAANTRIDGKQNRIDTVGILKGTGSGNITAATVGTDILTGNSGELRYEIFYDSGNFYAPSNIINPVHVICMGGGGGGATSYNEAASTARGIPYGGAGGSGRFVETDVVLTPNTYYAVQIGAAGDDGTPTSTTLYSIANGKSGGTTTFGTLVSAPGGQGGQGVNGGYGGSGGGGAYGYGSTNGGNGGRGYEFGGGGGGGSASGTSDETSNAGNGGAGGTYGGGGGGGGAAKSTWACGTGGAAGTYGGRGGAGVRYNQSITSPAAQGSPFVPSIYFLKLYKDLTGRIFESNPGSTYGAGGGGGGGYGGNGGNGVGIGYGAGGGGGGGYGCDGYSAYSKKNYTNMSAWEPTSGGGGGGYGQTDYIEYNYKDGYEAETDTHYQNPTGGRGFFNGTTFLRWNSSISSPVDIVRTTSRGGDGRWTSSRGYSSGGNYHAGSGVCVVFYRLK